MDSCFLRGQSYNFENSGRQDIVYSSENIGKNNAEVIIFCVNLVVKKMGQEAMGDRQEAIGDRNDIEVSLCT